MATSDVRDLPLRERKKLITRQALIDTAEELFAERGFDNVTVAEIADAVNIATKTVFVYFPAKEDLVFHGENEMRDLLVDHIRDRDPGQTPLDAVATLLSRLMITSPRGPVADLDRLVRTVGDSTVLRSRMRLMWERFEEAIAAVLAEETGEQPHAPRPRVAAAQIIVVFRTMSTPDVMAYLRSHPKAQRRKAFDHWLTVATEMVGQGIADYARRD
jgi:AcrR family transcriptional regulator